MAKISYSPLVVAFDIETTSYTSDDHKRAIVYSYALDVDDVTTIHRTRSGWLDQLDDLVEQNDISIDHRLVVYVHNLAYEFAFIRRYMAFETVFANGSPNNVIKAVTVDGIEFRCSLALTNLALKNVGDGVGVKKLVGDLDYELMRHHETPLTDDETAYIVNDVKIVSALIRKKLEEDTLASIPMTKTGYVRRDMRKETLRSKHYKKIMHRLQITNGEYVLARGTFQGGYTHASFECSGKVLKNVVSYDLSSSYPSSIAQFIYPVSNFTEVTELTPDEFKYLLDSNCSMFIDVTFEEIETNYTFPAISESKCIEVKDANADNGRLYSATSARVLVTDVDYRMLTRNYKIGKTHINSLWVAEADYLPTELVQPILEMYATKTTLKGVAGAEVLYQIAKENINSVYGMIATDPVRDNFEWNGYELVEEVIPIEEQLEKLNKSRNRFLYYAWAPWVTAYSRFILLETIMDLEDAGVTVAYCDTDSIYAVDHPAIAGIMEAANERIVARLRLAMDHHDFGDEDYDSHNESIAAEKYLFPTDKNGNIHPLGVFECETKTPIDEFKTLGAKRYAKKIGDRFFITVAGMSKHAGDWYDDETSEWVEGYVNTIGGMDAFCDGLAVPPEHSGRLVHGYSDERISNVMTDYLGNTATVEQHGYIHLEKTGYSMTLGDVYSRFLDSIQHVRG